MPFTIHEVCPSYIQVPGPPQEEANHSEAKETLDNVGFKLLDPPQGYLIWDTHFSDISNGFKRVK